MRRWVFIALVLASTLAVSLFVLSHQIELGTMYTLYRFTGPFVRNCGLASPDDDPHRVAECVVQGQKVGKPFVAVFQVYGKDSEFTEGIARNADGMLRASGYDDMAPAVWIQAADSQFATQGRYRFLFRKFNLVPCVGIREIPGKPGWLECRPLEAQK